MLTGIPPKKSSTGDTMRDIYNDVAAVNHEGNNQELGRGTNCLYCTTAYEMRRRGYDVQAQQDWIGGIRGDMPSAMFEGAKTETIYDISNRSINEYDRALVTREGTKAMIDTIAEQGDGARGYVGVQWYGGQGGHSMAYEVADGKVMLIDCQTGEVMTGESIWEERLYYADRCEITRVDNCDFNKELVDRYIEDSGSEDSNSLMDDVIDRLFDRLKKKNRKKKKKSKGLKKQINRYEAKVSSIWNSTKRKSSRKARLFVKSVKDVI